jgi:putative ATP-dependent endonuclease of OLD family
MYLSKIRIHNYKGIKELEVNFDSKINIIIGENGSCKSALIDAIRLLYNLGNQRRDIYVSKEDFYIDPSTLKNVDQIEILYEFRELSEKQKGAFHEYLVLSKQSSTEDYVQVVLKYEYRNDRSPTFSYFTGAVEGQRADPKTFELFQHYYLGALRDSTRDLLDSRTNILGGVIKRLVDKNDTSNQFEGIISDANNALLKQGEVINTRNNINDNLGQIFQQYPENKIGLQIEHSKIEYIVNLIKPYLPFDKTILEGNGLSIWQNSLGFNNLIYIATILGDINQRIEEDELTHFSLLIEEPEAHLHPQLQLSLYNFLKSTNKSANSQLFITTHSPTLTSKAPLDNLTLLAGSSSYRISNCFKDRENDGIIQDTTQKKKLSNTDFLYKKKQLERYVDVTKSQLFYSKGILLVEGISEELLLPAFSQVLGYRLEDFRIELVNVDGITFYPFIHLFSATAPTKRLPLRVSVISDDDRFTEAKKISFDDLCDANFAKLLDLSNKILAAKPATRISNIFSSCNGQSQISINAATQTLEFEIALNNVADKKIDFESNFLVAYLKESDKEKFAKINSYRDTLPEDGLTELERYQLAILLWKALPSKADFAQDFSIALSDLVAKTSNTAKLPDDLKFIVPTYIKNALSHLTEK